MNKLLELHQPLPGEKIVMSPESAMMTKYASNAYLALRIAFINEIANLCEKSDADIEEVIRGLGADRRIGSHYWYPGLGYGGSCFPKDVKELGAFAKSVGEEKGLFEKVDELNELRIPRLLKKLEKMLGGFRGKTVAVLGVSFKPNTNDMREAPSIKCIPLLIEKGAKVRIYDPKSIAEAKKIFEATVDYSNSVRKAVEGVDGLMVLTEWDEFKQMDLAMIKKSMRGDVFFDSRNVYDPKIIKQHKFRYLGIGR
jgi:UDPglucose 6-dehydrogenase